MISFIIALLVSTGAFSFNSMQFVPVKKKNPSTQKTSPYTPNESAPTLNIVEEEYGGM